VSSGLGAVAARPESMSGFRLVDLLFTRLDEGIDRRAVATWGSFISMDFALTKSSRQIPS
jgi:hypothetical protein